MSATASSYPPISIRTEDAEGTRWVGEQLAKTLVGGDLILLVGGLGAGKTTFTQGLGEGLQVEGRVTSPTYIVSRIHRGRADGPDLVHVDAYRLEDELDLETIDLETTSDQSVTVVEWGAGKVEHLADQWLEVHLQPAPQHETRGGTQEREREDPEAEANVSMDEGGSAFDEPRRLTLLATGPDIAARLGKLAASDWLEGGADLGVTLCSV